MSVAEACGPVGLGCLLLGMAMFGEGHWPVLGLVLGAVGAVLLFARW